VTGPSNIGNLLAQRGIAATCGFARGQSGHNIGNLVEYAASNLRPRRKR